MRSLAIIGAGGHGKVVADIAEQCGFQKIDFYDDGKEYGYQVGVWHIQGTLSDALQRLGEYDGAFVAIGDNAIRSRVAERIPEEKRLTLVHPKAIVSDYVKLGTGTIVMPGAIINAFSLIGEGVIINTAAVIEHDCVIGDYSHVSPGATLAGEVLVGHHCWLGANCAVRQGNSIGSKAVVGMAAVVVKNVAESTTVVGLPAKVLSK